MEAASVTPTKTKPAPTEEAVPEAVPEAAAPVAEDGTAVETSPATEQTPARMFRYSEWVHVGEGAEECPGATTGACEDEDHFHAWCRLPNQFQQSSIRDKALAAKARRVRQLRDPETDLNAVLESDMAAIAATGDKESMIEDLAASEFLKAHIEATKEVAEQEDFATISDDIERLRVLSDMEAEDRPSDEYDELQRHIASYHKAIEEERTKLETPYREALAEKPVEELLTSIRETRIEAEGTEEFMRAYSEWEWYVCTLKPRANGRPKERVFPHINEMLSEAQEVLEALDRTFSNLEAELQQSAGNS